MPKETWIAGAVLTVLAVVGVVVLASRQHGREIDQSKNELGDARAALSKSQAEAEELSRKLSEAQSQNEDLKKEQEAAIQMHKGLEDEMRSALESKDVTISQLQGKLTVNILDRVLFSSGEADLKPEGANVLRKVGTILLQHTNVTVHVVGHTDNVPIRASARSRFASNWELSTARATAAVRYLTESAGLDPRRFGAVGYGEFRPLADNSTAEGRARNRRIVITIVSDELVGADTTQAKTNRMAPVQTTFAKPATNSLSSSKSPDHAPED
ncbi:MAG TPA: OmpA family protein [Candidatus Dormibacteraeota bacterium]|nr:OmpA family protein [Candidatus Dormibacteraeota bacterium]